MRILLVCAAAGLALAAGAASAADKLKVGFISSFSGPAAVIAFHQRSGWELAVQHLNGKAGGLEIETVYGDDQVRPDVAIRLVDKMMREDKVDIVAGIIWPHVLSAVQKRVTQNKTLLVSTNASGRTCNPYLYTTALSDAQTAAATGALAQADGAASMFMIAPNYRAGADQLDAFQLGYRGAVAGRALTRVDQTNYQTEIAQIRESNPDGAMVFLPAAMGAAFLKQWSASGLGAKIRLYTISTTSWLNIGSVGEAALNSRQVGFWGPDLDSDENRRFVKDFSQRFGMMPSRFAAQSYDALLVVDAAIRAAGGSMTDRDAVRDAMAKVDVATTRGKFRFDAAHRPVNTFYRQEVVRGRNGKPAIVTGDAIAVGAAGLPSAGCSVSG